MTTEELHKRLQGIQGCWDQALAGLEEVSGGFGGNRPRRGSRININSALTSLPFSSTNFPIMPLNGPPPHE
jgi:hypothetical protein